MDRISSTNVNYAIRAYAGTGPVTKPNGAPLPHRTDAPAPIAKRQSFNANLDHRARPLRQPPE